MGGLRRIVPYDQPESGYVQLSGDNAPMFTGPGLGYWHAETAELRAQVIPNVVVM